MRLMAYLSLLFVVLLDVMGQGLVIPIITTLLLEDSSDFLPSGTSEVTRQIDYGLAMGVFFLCWFLGAAYISRVSDSIGRKQGILICLSGNLAGYVLTIASLEMRSFWLLLVARAITGFTAGNQPIAQAALLDLCDTDAQKSRSMGLVVTALSLGLVAGPLLGGLLSDPEVIGSAASPTLPFYVACGMVLTCIALIVVFFHNRRAERPRFRFEPAEVFLTLWRAARRPTVLKLSLVFFFAQLGLNSYYVFLSPTFTREFQFGTLENSIALIVMGVAMGTASAVLVKPLNARFRKVPLVAWCVVLMMVSAVAAIVNPWPLMAYVLIVPFIVPFAIYYPTTLTLYSASVGQDEQGWIMGVTVALYTLGAGLVSVIGGRLASIDVRFPFAVAAASLVLALLLIAVLWRRPDVRELDPGPAESSG